MRTVIRLGDRLMGVGRLAIQIGAIMFCIAIWWMLIIVIWAGTR